MNVALLLGLAEVEVGGGGMSGLGVWDLLGVKGSEDVRVAGAKLLGALVEFAIDGRSRSLIPLT